MGKNLGRKILEGVRNLGLVGLISLSGCDKLNDSQHPMPRQEYSQIWSGVKRNVLSFLGYMSTPSDPMKMSFEDVEYLNDFRVKDKENLQFPGEILELVEEYPWLELVEPQVQSYMREFRKSGAYSEVDPDKFSDKLILFLNKQKCNDYFSE